jgi:uncharacterized protein (TIGR03437 family)
VLSRLLVCSLLLTAAASAATPGFLLGLDYSEWGPYLGSSTQQIAADGAGALYLLSQCAIGGTVSCVAKYAADGKTLVWQNSLGAAAGGMAIDPNGGVYIQLLPPIGLSSNAGIIEKLTADGKSLVWTAPLTAAVSHMAVDSTGRAFLLTATRNVVRFTAGGSIDATIPLPNIPGTASGLAVDPSGTYVLVTYLESLELYPSDMFALYNAGSGAWVTFTPPLGTFAPGIAVAPNGDAVIYGTDALGNRSLQRISATGAVVFSKAIASQTMPAASNESAPGNLALDAAGNAYITGYTAAYGAPVRHSLAECGSAWLGVYGPDGTALQITYLPGATSSKEAFGSIAVGGSSVFVVDQADTNFSPSQTGPFPQYLYGPNISPASFALFHLSPNAAAQTLSLACAANAASFVASGPVAPGELLALYGNDLGPAAGVQPAASLTSPFPTQAALTQVTFDGKAAPLLWVQESQVNVAVPWSVAGPTTQICVTYNNVKTNCLTRNVAQFAPGVFTVDGAFAAAINQDGTINSAAHPAPINSIVSLWATGTGPISPALPDGALVGLPLPVNSAQAAPGQFHCAGLGCPVSFFSSFPTQYAGPAPYLISGTTQINFPLTSPLPGGTIPSTQTLFTLGVPGTSGSPASSNTFQIYVAGQ